MALAIDWQIEAVEVAGNSTQPSLAFSPSGQPAIAYHSSQNDGLRFAEKQVDGSWGISTVDNVNGDISPSLAFRFSEPAISYWGSSEIGSNGKEIRYAFRRGHPGWTIETVTPKAHRSSLAIGPSHQPGMSYGVPGTGPGTGLIFARSVAPLTWVGNVADPDEDAGFECELAFTPSGQPAIAYLFDAHDLIKYAVFNGSQWTLEDIGANSSNDSLSLRSLAFTPAGEPAICYEQSIEGSSRTVVNFAVRRSGSWNREMIATGHSGCLAFSLAGEPAISYIDSISESVKYALFTDRSWQHFTVEPTGKTPDGNWFGTFVLTSLAFSASGQPAIGYYDRYNATIRYAIGTAYQQGMLKALFY